MSMVFPGMDPYLEDPLLWPGVHHAMIVYIRDHLRPTLRPRYIRDVFELYPRRLRDRLPRVGIPLAEDDADVWLDLPAVLAQTYEAGSYAERINTRPGRRASGR